MATTMYKGHWIEFNFYKRGEYTVQYGDSDLWFDTEEEAKAFIDSIEKEENEDGSY